MSALRASHSRLGKHSGFELPAAARTLQQLPQRHQCPLSAGGAGLRGIDGVCRLVSGSEYRCAGPDAVQLGTAGHEPDRHRAPAVTRCPGAATVVAGTDRQRFRAFRALVRCSVGRRRRLFEPVVGVLAVQDHHRQRGHGLWRFQAVGTDRRLGWLAGAAADIAAVVGGGGVGGRVSAACTQAFHRYRHAVWPLSGHCGVDCRALG
ncbi:hypothetical protein D3C79_855520 [compost metagenome]